MTIPIFTLEQLGVPIRIAQLARELHARRLTDLNILHDSSPVFLDVVGEHATWRCDNQSVAFATLEARNQCVAALAHSEWCAGRNAEDHKGLFDTAHMLWRIEIGHSDQASGRFLALAHSTTNIFTSAAARLADADSKVFDVLHAVGAAIGYLDSFEPADLIAFVEAQYEKTKRDMASGLLFNTIEQAIARDPTTCRALNTAVKEKATVPISGLYQTTLLALARAGELDEAVATAMRDTQSQDPLVQQLAHWSIALLLAQYEIPESTQDRCVELLRVACRSAPIAPIGDRPRLSPENNRGLSPIVPTNANVGGSYTYNYNGAGELLSQTDPKSQVTKQQYDAVGRMTERDEHGTTSTWAYDDCGKGIGKLCSTSKVGASHVYVYDAQARTQQVKTTIDNQEFVRTTLYNPKGQLSYVGYPQTEPGQQPLGLTTTYNVHGFADKVQRTGAVDPYWTATARYDDGSFASGTNGAAPYEKDYDVLGRLSVVRLRSAQSALVHTSNYSYDKIGNLTSRAQQPASVGPQNAERFCYDSLNRVTHASVGTGIDCSAAAQYIYSVDGNLTTKNGATGAVGT
ncbi:MAG: RHS repeat protein, partial [Burkholderiales bacterium]|nr:RHS repeat protein [Burkholderiales bacterium]